MRKKVISVRQHPRRKPSGGKTIVSRHQRKLASSFKRKSEDPFYQKYEDLAIKEVALDLGRTWSDIEGTPTPSDALIPFGPSKIDPRFGFERIAKLQEHRDHLTDLRIEIYINTGKLLSNLNLPLSLRTDIVSKSMEIYESYPLRAPARSPENIVPIALYLTSLERDIFLPWSELIKDHPKPWVLKKMLVDGLANDRALYNKIRSHDFRKDRILQMLSGLQSTMNLPQDFYENSQIKLDKNYHMLSGYKDSVIAAIIWDDLVDTYAKGQVAKGLEFLNVGRSTVSSKKSAAKREGKTFILKSPQGDEALKKEIEKALWYLL